MKKYRKAYTLPVWVTIFVLMGIGAFAVGTWIVKWF